MTFDLAQAMSLWEDAYRREDWDSELQALRIAGLCGLGVLSVDAMKYAIKCIRADRGPFVPDASAARWANCLLSAATHFPVPACDYPIPRPSGHVVGTPPCFDRQRKGSWTCACMRAAWGNISPYGLDHAVKPCPRCGREMRYWCQYKGKMVDEAAFRWTVDHIVAHAAGGCVCHFNLAAICPSCNSSKGKRGI